MRHYFSLPLLTALLLLLGACTSVRYGNDYKAETDFSNLKTYQWRAVTVDIAGVDIDFMQTLASDQLRAQGFIAVDQGADLLVDMQAFTRASSGGNTSIGIGIGLPVGRSGNIGLGTGQTLGKGKQEGTIVIDIVKADKGALIWRGSAEGIPLINFSLKAEHKLRETFTTLLRPFPPQAALK